jgi:hypothetical protein
MRGADRRAVLIINPLKHTLAHYEGELRETLNHSGNSAVEIADTAPGDGITGPRQRVAVAARTMWQRMKMAGSVRGQTVIVVWPLFGYLEPLTWMRLARQNTVYIVMHDPSPLRRTYGQSPWARYVFKAAVHRRSIRVLYHTAHAQRVGAGSNGVKGVVVPHPIRLEPSRIEEPHGRATSRAVVRVLGQYKHTRSLTALTAIADQAAGSCELEIHGRGWPDVPGWTVMDRFVPENEFTALVASSDCVVIPYDSFFQSGVAVRCLEAGVPVVAPHHEHIAQLYGDEWAGTVRSVSDWYHALVRALAVDAVEIRSRHLCVAEEIRDAWQELLSTGGEVPASRCADGRPHGP